MRVEAVYLYCCDITSKSHKLLPEISLARGFQFIWNFGGQKGNFSFSGRLIRFAKNE